jgi:hypothetical protein
MSNAVCFTAAVLVLVLPPVASGQQVADTGFKPAIERPAYPPGHGPLVLVDEAHFNFHTATGRYLPFADLLRRDGYTVKGSTARFTRDTLGAATVLVIANALGEPNSNGDWSLPTPSAFTGDEVAAVREWVRGGGSLLLIADHMPFAGAADTLAAAFGVRFSNGFAQRENGQGGPDRFTHADGTLRDHPVTRGRSAPETVDSVVSFTGSAFQAPPDAHPLMVLGDGFVSLEPEIAWKFDDRTRRVAVVGWCQGATLDVGKGRVAVFGEAAMFTAQLAGAEKRPLGMNAPEASRNAQFLLNVLHWLTRQLDERQVSRVGDVDGGAAARRAQRVAVARVHAVKSG